MKLPDFFRPKALATEASVNVVRVGWDRLSQLPGGKRLFSGLVGRAAPYTGTMRAQIEEVRDGYSRVTMNDRKSVRNHLESVHAVALANLVELTGNIAVAYTLPDDARFIVAGMSLDYLKKAHGKIIGECNCPSIASSARQEYQVPVTLMDNHGEVVVKATLRTLVGPKTSPR